jgi:hypothetical protein
VNKETTNDKIRGEYAKETKEYACVVEPNDGVFILRCWRRERGYGMRMLKEESCGVRPCF